MIFLKLLGNALGSVLMYWGVALFCIAFWFLGVFLRILLEYGWRKLTGQSVNWKWFFAWLKPIGERIPHIKFAWFGWLPGIFIQVWYAGYAAALVQSETLDAALWYALAVNGTGVISVIVAAAIFYWLYIYLLEVNLGWWLYLLLGGTALSAYVVLLEQTETAAWLSESWQRVLAALLTEFVGSL